MPVAKMEWNLQSRGRECRACETAFKDKQIYHTLLFDEKQTYERHDVCEDCWTSQYSEGATERKGFVSHWQGVYLKPQPTPEPMRKENAESLLRKLIEGNEPDSGPAIYILAVMLERKRILKVKEQIRSEEGRVFVYEHPKNGDLFTIRDPELQLDQLEEVQKQVAQLMEYGLTPPAAEVADDQEITPAVETEAQLEAESGETREGDVPAVEQEEAPIDEPCRT